MSHYRVLGVPRGATRAEIRAAYVRAARRAHPDLHRTAKASERQAAVDQMCAINEAWRVLGDTSRRRVYDQHRIAAAAGASSVRRPPRPAPTASAEPRPDRIPGAAPVGGHGTPLIFLPAVAMVLAVAQFVIGLFLGAPALLTSGAVTFGLAVAAFAAAPLLMLASSRSDRRTVVG